MHHQDQVNGLATDLRPDAAAGDRQKRRRRPRAVLLATYAQYAVAALTAHYESALEQRGEHCDARGFFHDALRDGLVAGGHDLLQDEHRVIDALGFIRRLGRKGGNRKGNHDQRVSHTGLSEVGSDPCNHGRHRGQTPIETRDLDSGAPVRVLGMQNGIPFLPLPPE